MLQGARVADFDDDAGVVARVGSVGAKNDPLVRTGDALAFGETVRRIPLGGIPPVLRVVPLLALRRRVTSTNVAGIGFLILADNHFSAV